MKYLNSYNQPAASQGVLVGLAVLLLLALFRATLVGPLEDGFFSRDYPTTSDRVAAMNKKGWYLGSDHALQAEYAKAPTTGTGQLLYRNLLAAKQDKAAVAFGYKFLKDYPDQTEFRIEFAYSLADQKRFSDAMAVLQQGINLYHTDNFVAAQTEVTKRQRNSR